MAHRHRRLRGRLILAVVTLTALVSGCGPDNDQNSLRPEGPAAEKIHGLFMPITVVAVIVGVLVLAGTFYVALRFRRRSDDEQPKQIHGSTPLEIGWTIVPALILVIIAIPTIATIFQLADVPKGDDVLEVRVVGKQWWWEFEYSDQKVVTANELYIPVDTKVRLDLTACDESLGEGASSCNVIHSFWVPELAGKQDVVPGRKQGLTIEADEPGTYLGQCAEYCGLSHANMRFRVIAVDKSEFDGWIEEQQEGPAVAFTTADAEGKQVPAGEAQELVSTTFQCTGCHAFDDSKTSSYGPNLTHLASRTTFAGGTFELNREDLVEWVLDAPGMIPMQSEDCRLPPPATCVGMPSFTEHTPSGDPVMARDQAETIVDYLLALK